MLASRTYANYYNQVNDLHDLIYKEHCQKKCNYKEHYESINRLHNEIVEKLSNCSWTSIVSKYNILLKRLDELKNVLTYWLNRGDK